MPSEFVTEDIERIEYYPFLKILNIEPVNIEKLEVLMSSGKRFRTGFWSISGITTKRFSSEAGKIAEAAVRMDFKFNGFIYTPSNLGVYEEKRDFSGEARDIVNSRSIREFVDSLKVGETINPDSLYGNQIPIIASGELFTQTPLKLHSRRHNPTLGVIRVAIPLYARDFENNEVDIVELGVEGIIKQD